MKNRLEFAFTATVMEIQTDIYICIARNREIAKVEFSVAIYIFLNCCQLLNLSI